MSRTRGMQIRPDDSTVSGDELTIVQYDKGNTSRRVRIELSENAAEWLAEKCVDYLRQKRDNAARALVAIQERAK